MHARLEKSIDQKTTKEMITPMYMCTARPLINSVRLVKRPWFP